LDIIKSETFDVVFLKCNRKNNIKIRKKRGQKNVSILIIVMKGFRWYKNCVKKVRCYLLAQHRLNGVTIELENCNESCKKKRKLKKKKLDTKTCQCPSPMHTRENVTKGENLPGGKNRIDQYPHSLILKSLLHLVQQNRALNLNKKKKKTKNIRSSTTDTKTKTKKKLKKKKNKKIHLSRDQNDILSKSRSALR
jgi:hypothetical protein